MNNPLPAHRVRALLNNLDAARKALAMVKDLPGGTLPVGFDWQTLLVGVAGADIARDIVLSAALADIEVETVPARVAAAAE